jgi:ADP-ribosyl-[dinitrogen reductase] hydrolase
VSPLKTGLGSDADTQAAIAGSVAEATYGGVPATIERQVMNMLPPDIVKVIAALRERLASHDRN